MLQQALHHQRDRAIEGEARFPYFEADLRKVRDDFFSVRWSSAQNAEGDKKKRAKAYCRADGEMGLLVEELGRTRGVACLEM